MKRKKRNKKGNREKERTGKILNGIEILTIKIKNKYNEAVQYKKEK